MSDIITIHLVDYYCRNCSLFGDCPVLVPKPDKDDHACSQIFEHFIGGSKDEDTKQQNGSGLHYHHK